MIEELRIGLPDINSMTHAELMTFTSKLAKCALDLSAENFYLLEQAVKSRQTIYLGDLQEEGEVHYDTVNDQLHLKDKGSDTDFYLTLAEYHQLVAMKGRINQIAKMTKA